MSDAVHLTTFNCNKIKSCPVLISLIIIHKNFLRLAYFIRNSNFSQHKNKRIATNKQLLNYKVILRHTHKYLVCNLKIKETILIKGFIRGAMNKHNILLYYSKEEVVFPYVIFI